MFVAYVRQEPIPRWEAEKRMFEKLEHRRFLADVHPLLAADERARFDDAAGRRAFMRVFEGLIGKVPGKAWATTPELIEKHGLGGGTNRP
jgi:hypothetical protein